MGRRGPKPDYAKRDRLAELLSRGVSLSEAARTVGVNRRTGGIVKTCGSACHAA
jgi:lambda repressor-like predicted transcriptional regulator